MDLKFVTEPDAAGYGRVITEGRYFGLPMELIIYFQTLHTLDRLTAKALEAQQPNQPVGRVSG